jgi:peptidoglycan/LPS O-acetylase OafA/YrhL
MKVPIPNKLSGYMPTLDGWRAISIILVVLSHNKITLPNPSLAQFLQRATEYGASGVYIFFAISGVLICGRMLQEEKKHGRISLRKFYIRRAFRILPPVLLYLLTIAVLSPILGVGKLEWFSSLFFFRNYEMTVPPAHWFTGHFWSLSVEEHFYLLLPGILVFFPKRRVWVLGILTGAVMIWRFWLAHHTTLNLNTKLDLDYRTDTVIDALLIAALIAIAANNDRYAVYMRPLLTPLASAVLVGTYITLQIVHIPQTLSILIEATIPPLVLLGTAQNARNFAGRILESAPLRWIGRLSFSLYLWQELFFCDLWWRGPLPLGPLQQWPLKLVGLLVCASISYYLVERPMMRMGHRIASSGVPGRDVDQSPLPGPAVPSLPNGVR